MSTNYFALKINEDMLMKKFCDYWNHAIQMHKFIRNFLQNFSFATENMHEFDELIKKWENESNKMHAEIIDSAIWIISKDQPHASHLRFIIAVVSSSFDLERICDYANNIHKFLTSHVPFSSQVVNILEEIITTEINIFVQIFLFFQKNSALDSYEFAMQRESEFKQTFLECVKKIKKIFSSTDVDIIIELILALKHVERTIDHTIDIIQKFVYIKDLHFFFRH